MRVTLSLALWIRESTELPSTTTFLAFALAWERVAVQPSPSTGLFALLPLQVRAMRLSFVGELGWELHVPRADCVKVYRAVMEAGARHGIANAGYRAIDSLSIEKGPSLLPAALPAFPPAGEAGQDAFPPASVRLEVWQSLRMLRLPQCGLLSGVFYPGPRMKGRGVQGQG